MLTSYVVAHRPELINIGHVDIELRITVRVHIQPQHMGGQQTCTVDCGVEEEEEGGGERKRSIVAMALFSPWLQPDTSVPHGFHVVCHQTFSLYLWLTPLCTDTRLTSIADNSDGWWGEEYDSLFEERESPEDEDIYSKEL